MESQPCPICLNSPAEIHATSERTLSRQVDCRFCGSFRITLPAFTDLEQLTTERYLLSGTVRQHSERGVDLLLSTENIPELIRTARPPETPLEAIDQILLLFADRLDSPAAEITLSGTEFPLILARSDNEFVHYLSKAKDLGFIEWVGGGMVEIDIAGWQRLIELRRTRAVSDQAFVAMWFSDHMRSVWLEGFEPALKVAGYRPVRMDLVEHNEKIDDRIIAEIRRSGLVVADFTGHRGGVYFEAGFAMGLGIPVIWTCAESEVGALHFDTRQFNHIVWKDASDLREKLRLRIEASIPGRARDNRPI